MSGYMDNNTKAADSRSNSCAMSVENPYDTKMAESPKVNAGSNPGGTPPMGDELGTKSELTYTDDNSAMVSENGADSRAKNRNTIIELPSADASPSEVKNFGVDEFQNMNYTPAVVSPEGFINMSGLRSKELGGKK